MKCITLDTIYLEHIKLQSSKEHFEEMLEALENYQELMGEQYPFITNTEKLASLTALYVAEQIIGESEILNDNWNEGITEETIEEFKKEMKETYGL